MEKWIIASNQGKQNIAVGAAAIVGLVLTVSLRSFSGVGGSGVTTESAGFFLGLLLLIAGVGGIVFQSRRVVTVDPKARTIEIDDANRFSAKKHVLPFSQITGVELVAQGDPEGGSIAYDLMLRLKDAKDYSLFGKAYFDGRYDKSMRSEQKGRLEQYLRS